MAAPSAIRTALQTNLKNCDIRVYDTLPDNPAVPCAVIFPGEPFIQRQTMKLGVVLLHFTVTILVTRAVDTKAQNALDALLATSGAASGWAAIEHDITLGGLGNVSVMECRGYKAHSVGPTDYLGAEFRVQVLATG
jgi:hypothetical protein